MVGEGKSQGAAEPPARLSRGVELWQTENRLECSVLPYHDTDMKAHAMYLPTTAIIITVV